VVFLLLGVAVTPVLAAGTPPTVSSARTAFVVSGTITGIDTTNKTVTLTATHGNQISKRILAGSKMVMLTTQAQTRFLMWAKDGAKKVTFVDLQVGQNLMA
jgi:hypothetical protein